jgi:hypothetical protein
MKTMVNEFYMLCVRMFLLINTCYTKHHPSTVNRGTNYTLRLIFAPRCYCEYFSSRKEKGCDHPVIIVALDNVWDYVGFLSRWYHRGYYNIKSKKVFYTAQLFAMGSSSPEAWQNITRKVNRKMI